MHLKNAVSSPADVSVDSRLQTVVNSMQELIKCTENNGNSKLVFSLSFLMEQVQLLLAAQQRYSPDCLLIAFSIFFHLVQHTFTCVIRV